MLTGDGGGRAVGRRQPAVPPAGRPAGADHPGSQSGQRSAGFGGVTEAEALAAETNIITRAVGGQQQLFLDIAVFDVAPDDTFLLCSDGLYRDLTLDELAMLLAAPNSAVDAEHAARAGPRGPGPGQHLAGRRPAGAPDERARRRHRIAHRPQPGAAGAGAGSVSMPRVLKQRFVLDEKLGSGGMGTVFRAKDLRKVEARDRHPYVAVKVLNNDFREHPEAFIALQREAAKSQGCRTATSSRSTTSTRMATSPSSSWSCSRARSWRICCARTPPACPTRCSGRSPAACVTGSSTPTKPGWCTPTSSPATCSWRRTTGEDPRLRHRPGRAAQSGRDDEDDGAAAGGGPDPGLCQRRRCSTGRIPRCVTICSPSAWCST
jgi:hypothetical protein